MSTPALTTLAKQILELSTSLEHSLSDQNVKQPSFLPRESLTIDEDSPAISDFADDYYHNVLNANPSTTNTVALESIITTRSQLIETAQTLLSLARGPVDSLRTIIGIDRTNLAVLKALHDLNVHNAVPYNSTSPSPSPPSITFTDLATKVSAHPAPLERLLRYAFTLHLFHEPTPNHVAHTSTSLAMRNYSPYMWLMLGDDHSTGAWEASLHLTQALRIAPSNPASSSYPTPFEMADPKQRNYWQAIQQDYPNGQGMQKFSAAMKTFSVGVHGDSYRHYTSAYDWSALGAGPLIDVGGGNGHNAVAIAKAFPELHIVVQDLATNAEGARSIIEAAGLEGRVSFVTQDFFAAQPNVGVGVDGVKPKAYMLSRVLHDWGDDDCLKILRNLVLAMEEHDAKLVVVDRALPDAGDGGLLLHKEAQLRSIDVLMYTFYGPAKERTLTDWRKLFGKADQRLTVLGMNQRAESEFAVIEVGLVA